MANRNCIEVPNDVDKRYRPDERVKHVLVQRRGEVSLWRSTLQRNHLDLPEQVRFHVTESGDGIAVLVPDLERALHIFGHAVDRAEAYREFFLVVRDEVDNLGRHISGVPLSREIARKGALRRVYKRLVKSNPTAYCRKHTIYC